MNTNTTPSTACQCGVPNCEGTAPTPVYDHLDTTPVYVHKHAPDSVQFRVPDQRPATHDTHQETR